MATIIGTITKKDLEEGTTKFGKPYFRGVFTINEKKYSTFNEDIINKFKRGDVVKMTGKKEGQYWNMKTMELHDSEDIDNQTPSEDVTVDLLRQILAELKMINERAK